MMENTSNQAPQAKEPFVCRICATPVETGRPGLCRRCRSENMTLEVKLSAALDVADEISVDYYETERVVFAGRGVPRAHIDMANEGEVFFDGEQMIELCIGDEISTASFLDLEGEEHFLAINMVLRKAVTQQDFKDVLMTV